MYIYEAIKELKQKQKKRGMFGEEIVGNVSLPVLSLHPDKFIIKQKYCKICLHNPQKVEKLLPEPN